MCKTFPVRSMHSSLVFCCPCSPHHDIRPHHLVTPFLSTTQPNVIGSYWDLLGTNDEMSWAVHFWPWLLDCIPVQHGWEWRTSCRGTSRLLHHSNVLLQRIDYLHVDFRLLSVDSLDESWNQAGMYVDGCSNHLNRTAAQWYTCAWSMWQDHQTVAWHLQHRMNATTRQLITTQP